MRLRPPAYDRGILFVHGIGDQPRADTLLQCGDPLLRWLERWLTGERRRPYEGVLRVERVRLSEEQHADVPAHAVVEISCPGQRPYRDPDRRERWLLAEGRWAHEAQRPAFTRLAAWMLTTGAWILLSHGLRWARGHPKRLHRAIRLPQAVVASLVLTSTLQLAILVLLVLSVLPIPRLRAMLSDVVLRASGVLGDSYVLLESALQRRAIVDAVRRSLAWLAAECREVAVIAHSQGAAVAHEALRDPEPRNVVLLVTYGSGLTKLEELKVMGERNPDLIHFAKYGIPLTVAAIVVALRVTMQNDPWAWRALLWCAVPIVMLLVAATVAHRAPQALRDHLKTLSLGGRPRLDWLDLYATADAVPNGAMSIAGIAVDGVESRPVSNRGTQFRDHTTYWQNESEFIPAVLQRLDARFGCGLFDDAAETFAAAAAAHGRRVRWLTAARWSAMAAAWLWIIALFDRLEQIGRDALGVMQTPPLTPIGSFVAGFGHGIGRLGEWAFGVDAGAAVPVGHTATGGMLIAAGVAVAYRVFFAAWQAWERLHVSALLEPRSMRGDLGIRLAGVAAMGLGFTPAVLAVAVCAALIVEYPWTFTERLVYQVLGAAFVALFWVLVVAAFVGVRANWAEGTRYTRRNSLVTLSLLLVLALLLTPSLLPPGVVDLLMFSLYVAGVCAAGVEYLGSGIRILPPAYRVVVLAAPAALLAVAAGFLVGRPPAAVVTMFEWLPLVSGLLALYGGMVWALAKFAGRMREGRRESAAPPAAGV